MQASPLHAEEDQEEGREIFFFFVFFFNIGLKSAFPECKVMDVGINRMKWRKRRNSWGVDMKTGPYGGEGVRSDRRSVSTLQRQGQTETKS